MIDIHSHILPGVDDGSQSIDESLDMIQMAAECGVRVITATPHCNIPDTYENYAGTQMNRRYAALKEAVEVSDTRIKLIRGMEVYATEDLPELLDRKKVWTLNGTRNLLMEFSFDEDPDFCFRILREVRKRGITPVIAHPERYFFVQDNPGIAFRWCTEGAVLQLNKGSVTGSFGPAEERTSERLIRHNLAACIASDAHSNLSRTPDMREARSILAAVFGDDYAELLTEGNPGRILKGQPLLGYPPQPFR